MNSLLTNILDLPRPNTVLCLMVAALSCAFLYGKNSSRVDKFLSSLPGPLNLPLVGCALTFLCSKRRYCDWMSIFDKYATCKMYRLSLFWDDFAVSSDPEIIQSSPDWRWVIVAKSCSKEISVKPAYMPGFCADGFAKETSHTMYYFSGKQSTWSLLLPLFYTILRSRACHDKDKPIYDLFRLPDILSTANGWKWQNERKAVLPSFHPKFLSSFDAARRNRTKQLMATLKKYAELNQRFDLGQELTLLFIDIMSDSFLGVPADMQLNNYTEFATSLLEVPDRFMEQVLIPPYRCDFIWRICGGMQRFNSIKEILYSVSKQLIAKRKKLRGECGTMGKSQDDVLKRGKRIFLDILLDSEEQNHRDESELVFETGEIFTAGSITMGTVASWVLLLSGIFPEVGRRVYAEIDDVIDSSGEVFIPGEFKRLKYLDMVLKETLRHFGVPFIARRTQNDVHVKGFDLIPSNTRIIIMLASLHHHPEYWERPYEFYPEHFAPENVSNRRKNTFLPFSLGMRDCPGGKYAMETLTYVLAQILSEMEFKAVDMKPWSNVYADNSLKFGFTQVPKEGFIATAELRKNN